MNEVMTDGGAKPISCSSSANTWKVARRGMRAFGVCKKKSGKTQGMLIFIVLMHQAKRGCSAEQP